MSFVAIPGLIGPTLGPLAGGLIVDLLHWRMIFFVNIPIGLTGLYLILRYMPDYRSEQQLPLDLSGFIQFGAGIGLLSYVLEVFGEHTLSLPNILALLLLAGLLLASYVRHALRVSSPMIRLGLFKVRTFRIAIAGNLLTRLGVGGMPFLLPLLYQIGLHFSPTKAGLLVMPAALAAMTMKLFVQRLLTRFGYRQVLRVNTVLMGIMIALFSTLGPDAPAWRILLQAFVFGLFSSLQYSSMNTLVYSDLEARDASMGSSIASTVQQLSISFGIALASLTVGLLVGHPQAAPTELADAIRHACWLLAVLTMLSSLLFSRLHRGDGATVSQHESS